MDTDLWYQLPPDMEAWTNVVIENVARKIPEIPQYIQSISWDKFEPTRGDADGALYLMGGLAAAPVTIRSNRLAPVDIVATKTGKFYPLTPLFLQKIYADNVIGEPANDPHYDADNVSEGPGRRIRHYKTVDAVKHASIKTAKEFRTAIEKDASVANFMLKEMPDALEAIIARSEDNPKLEKVAKRSFWPQLQMVWKDNAGFHFNDEIVPAEDIGDFCKTAGILPEQQTAMLQGQPIVIDLRTKTAKLEIPDALLAEAKIKEMNASRTGEDTSSTVGKVLKNDEPAVLTTAVLRDHRVVPGIIFKPTLHTEDTSTKLKAHNEQFPVTRSNTFYPDEDDYATEVFVSAMGYGILPNKIKSTARLPITLEEIKEISHVSSPENGMTVISIGPGRLEDIGQILSTVEFGSHHQVVIESYLSGRPTSVNADTLYEVVENKLPVAYDKEELPVQSFTGVNCHVAVDADGNFVLDGESKSAVNCAYALMSKYAASYEDAQTIVAVAKRLGDCAFHIDEEDVKLAAKDKGTKSGTDDTEDDEKEDDSNQQKQPTQADNSSQTVDMSNPASLFQDPGPQGIPSISPAQALGPVNSEDLANVSKLNSPELMDNYLTSAMAANDMTGQETMMQASDAIVSALSQLSKLLFLIRQGNISYVSESDAQVAMNKLNDVAQSLGVNATQTM